MALGTLLLQTLGYYLAAVMIRRFIRDRLKSVYIQKKNDTFNLKMCVFYPFECVGEKIQNIEKGTPSTSMTCCVVYVPK